MRIERVAAVAKLSRRDAERDGPRPGPEVTDRARIPDRAGERLRNGIVCDFAVSGEADECSPHLERLRPVNQVDLGRYLAHQRILDHTRIETWERRNLYLSCAAIGTPAGVRQPDSHRDNLLA